MRGQVANNYLNQTWPIAGGGYALLTIVTPDPLPAEAVIGLEPVVGAMETWRTALAEMVHPGEAS